MGKVFVWLPFRLAAALMDSWESAADISPDDFDIRRSYAVGFSADIREPVESISALEMLVDEKTYCAQVDECKANAGGPVPSTSKASYRIGARPW